MDDMHVVLMDFDPDICPNGSCARLSELLKGLPSSRAIRTQAVTAFPSNAPCPPPDFILLRTSVIENLLERVQDLRNRWPYTPILGLFCTDKDAPAAVYHALQHGLDDFFSCPFRDIDMFPRIQRILESKETRHLTPQLSEVKAQLHGTGLVGESEPFLRVIENVLKVASSDATILLTGETGTGKELVARAIHYYSHQKDKPFVPVNCGALPDHLVENELFGHVKGAYTDAASAQQGLVAEAEEGTLFLDEVDTLSAPAQVKLLRFLQDRAYRPLGSSRSITAKVRIIAATNADLWAHVQAKRFREDLYYRLHVIALRLPSLSERPDDIPRLATHLLHRYGAQYGRASQRLSTTAMHKLVAYPWPGNIRELETVIHRVVLMTSAPVIQPDDIALPMPDSPAEPRQTSFREAKARVIEQFERTYLSNLLSICEGNISQAAKQAGKERRAFTRLLEKYGLHRSSFQV